MQTPPPWQLQPDAYASVMACYPGPYPEWVYGAEDAQQQLALPGVSPMPPAFAGSRQQQWQELGFTQDARTLYRGWEALRYGWGGGGGAGGGTAATGSMAAHPWGLGSPGKLPGSPSPRRSRVAGKLRSSAALVGLLRSVQRSKEGGGRMAGAGVHTLLEGQQQQQQDQQQHQQQEQEQRHQHQHQQHRQEQQQELTLRRQGAAAMGADAQAGEQALMPQHTPVQYSTAVAAQSSEAGCKPPMAPMRLQHQEVTIAAAGTAPSGQAGMTSLTLALQVPPPQQRVAATAAQVGKMGFAPLPLTLLPLPQLLRVADLGIKPAITATLPPQQQEEEQEQGGASTAAQGTAEGLPQQRQAGHRGGDNAAQHAAGGG